MEKQPYTWRDRWDIIDHEGNRVYRIRTKLSWGHIITIEDKDEEVVAKIKDNLPSYFPHFKIECGEDVGSVKRKFTLGATRFDMSFLGMFIKGDFLEDHYMICDRKGRILLSVETEYLNGRVRYVLDVKVQRQAVPVIALFSAIEGLKDLNSKIS